MSGVDETVGWLRARYAVGVVDPPRPAVVEIVARALAEDALPIGDLTAALVGPERHGRFELIARRAGVLAGRACALEVLAQVDPGLDVAWHLADGARLEPGTVVASLSGPMAAILVAERPMLNFLGHLSGVATLTRAFVDAVAATGSAARVIDTRKTLPGLRPLQKAAVRAGGGHNHRGNLSEAVLVKDNHLVGLDLAEAVARARAQWPGRMVEVECDRIEQVEAAASAGATVVMLDNMEPDDAAAAAGRAHELAPGVLVEVSGGVRLENAPEYARAGVDLISVGALTHSAPSLDLGLDAHPGGR